MRTRLLCIAVLSFSVFGAHVTSVDAQARKKSVIKVTKTEKMLRDVKATYRPFQRDDSFIVVYEGKELKEISVILIEASDVLVVLADVAAGREVDLTDGMMRKLLEFNMKADYLKVGISDIGSIRVQTEQELSLMSAKTFQKILDQAANVADDVAKILKPARKTSPAGK